MWLDDKTWADGYHAAIEDAVRNVAPDILDIRVVAADEEADQKRATDYIVQATTGDIACRIRRTSYDFRDWTIRSSRPSGVLTELDKLCEGWCRWYLYAWTQDATTFGDWILIDLDAVRESHILDSPRQETWNHDRSSAFVTISLDELRLIGALVHDIETIHEGQRSKSGDGVTDREAHQRYGQVERPKQHG